MWIFESLFLNYRWIFFCFYLLPISVFFDVYLSIKNWIVFKIYSSPNRHDQKVKNVQKQIHNWIKSGQKIPLCTSRTTGGRASYKNNLYNIKLNLLDILEINKENQTVRVEPLVTMGQLTSTLLPLGWTIPVAPGIDDLTVGGLVMGTGLDSSSHKYGLFQNTCMSYELVLSDGSLITCSKEENPDLFYAVPWSYGTLGFLTAVQIKMIPAKSFVKLNFKAFHNVNVAVEKFLEECENNDNDFIEGLMYNDNQCIVVTGQMVDKVEGKLNEIRKWYKPWFYQHVKSYFIKGVGMEYLSLKDYYSRHNRSTYWEVQDLIPFGNNIFFRMIFGWAVPSKLVFLKLTQAELVKKLYKDYPVMLDLIVPSPHLKSTLLLTDEEIGVYPIWLCPVTLFNHPGFVHSRCRKEMYINIGVYGVPKSLSFHSILSLEEIEEHVKDIGGFKMLYGDIHMNEEEFRKQFDHSLYDYMRCKLKCERAFPSVYEKMIMMKDEDFCTKKLKDWL